MPTYRRTTRVPAPIDEVWAFHSTIDGLRELTPDWMHLRISGVEGPDGQPDPDVLTEGSQIQMSIRPFGVGPRQRWVSDIVERREGDGEAMFRDEMREGPFPHWVHTHSFRADGDDGTIVRDRVEYELPGGPLGRAVGPLGLLGFEPMFRYRHRKTKELLE